MVISLMSAHGKVFLSVKLEAELKRLAYIKAKMHDQFLLISLSTSITERFYIYCSLNENVSTSNFKKNLYFVASHSKNITTV